jgi:hypothetical protein
MTDLFIFPVAVAQLSGRSKFLPNSLALPELRLQLRNPYKTLAFM